MIYIACGVLGMVILLPVLAGWGAAKGCPFCKGYCSLWRKP